MKYFKLQTDDHNEIQWLLSIRPQKDKKEWWDVWAFSRCEYYSDKVPIEAYEFQSQYFPGSRSKTHFASCDFNCYVVSWKLGNLILSVAAAGVQLVPITIDGEPEGQWFILNILDRVECIDFKRSKVEWGVRDGREMIVSVYHLEIEEEKADGHDIFRLGEFPVQVLVSERMAQAMKESGLDGFRLAPLPWDTLWN